MPTGIVKWFNGRKGFGFIEPEDGGNDVFVHITAVKDAGIDRLQDGDRVTYELIENRGRMAAGSIVVTGSGEQTPSEEASEEESSEEEVSEEESSEEEASEEESSEEESSEEESSEEESSEEEPADEASEEESSEEEPADEASEEDNDSKE